MAAATALPQLAHRERFQWHQAEVARRLEGKHAADHAHARAELLLKQLEAEGAVRAASGIHVLHHRGDTAASRFQVGFRFSFFSPVFRFFLFFSLFFLEFPCV